MQLRYLSLITITIGIAILALNFMYFSDNPQIFTIISMVAAVITLGVPLLYRYQQYNRIKKIETIFPIFLKDITKNINTGMTLPQAIKTACTTDYQLLTPYVKEMSAKITWGISFEKVLQNFAQKIGSPAMKRTTQTIIEAHRSGGTMNTVMGAVADSLQELERIKKERSASVYAQMVNGYLIYFIFLGVMIGLSTFLIPTFEWGQAGAAGADFQLIFIELFQTLIVIQGVFGGLAVGKMAEGTLVAGIKHALVLSLLGYSAFIIFV